MDFTVERNLKLNKYIFKVTEYKNIIAEMNYTYGILFRKLTVKNMDNNQISVMKQTNYFAKIANMIPFFYLFQYRYYRNKKCFGKTGLRFSGSEKTFEINGDLYKIHLHKDNIFSIILNNIQIAIIHKTAVTYAEHNKYFVKYDEKNDTDISLMVLFVMLIDSVYYPNYFTLSYMKHEKIVVGEDPSSRETLWTLNVDDEVK